MTPQEFKQIRKQLNFSQRQLALEMGLTDRLIRAIEGGKALITERTVKQINNLRDLITLREKNNG